MERRCSPRRMHKCTRLSCLAEKNDDNRLLLRYSLPNFVAFEDNRSSLGELVELNITTYINSTLLKGPK